ncbi:MAG: tetratricopeptide repeat protein [Acidobacteriaceae bacterium]
MKKTAILVILLLGTAFFFETAFAATRSGVDAASAAFRRGHADEALRAIDGELQRDMGNAAAWNLQCRVYLAQGRTDAAIDSCRRAVQLTPANSQFHVWLARAYGAKASASSILVAYKTAKLVRAEFETAVKLDGKNRDALADLGQYYVEAPKLLGGGCDKAQRIAQQLTALDPVRADQLRAHIAESKKDYSSAEQDLRAEIASSQSPEAIAQAWMDLGSFYRRRARWTEMLAALRKGAATDTVHGPALVDGASTLIQAKRETALAAQWLREYLQGNALSETAPAFLVHAQLGDLLKKQGDTSAADREFAAARALSADYVEAAGVNTGD